MSLRVRLFGKYSIGSTTVLMAKADTKHPSKEVWQTLSVVGRGYLVIHGLFHAYGKTIQYFEGLDCSTLYWRGPKEHHRLVAVPSVKQPGRFIFRILEKYDVN